MGYKDKNFKIDLSDLATGCFVEIKNPLLQPIDRNPRQVKKNEDGTPDEQDQIEASKEALAKLIVAWKMWDVNTEELLALPSEDATVLERCPQVIWNRVGQEIQRRSNPIAPQTGS
jgi:hypothetical protein